MVHVEINNCAEEELEGERPSISHNSKEHITIRYKKKGSQIGYVFSI